MKHIYAANYYKYQKKINHEWVEVDALSLKAGDTVKVFDAETGEQLTAEQGEKTFTLIEDYDGLHRIPYFA